MIWNEWNKLNEKKKWNKKPIFKKFLWGAVKFLDATTTLNSNGTTWFKNKKKNKKQKKLEIKKTKSLKLKTTFEKKNRKLENIGEIQQAETHRIQIKREENQKQKHQRQ